MKKFAGDIIILHMCNKNHNHMMYGSLDTEWDRQNFLSFWAIFCSFSPLTTWKIKIVKLKKSPGNIIIFHIFTINDNHYDVWFLRYGAKQTEVFVILDRFLPFYSPNNPKIQNFGKMKKKPEDIIILHMCTINDSHMMYGSWDMKHNGQNFLSFWTVFSHFTPNSLKN